MPLQVCMGATLNCTFGSVPGAFVVLPQNRVLTQTPAANITDNLPAVNIMPFAMCSSAANPAVAAATSAACGVLTPAPCVPVIPAPWVAGAPRVLIGGVPSLDTNSQLMCAWGGVIGVVTAGQTKVMLR
ncbi:MAG TPA: DUF4280 domain-containing protein [Blastocatellia bacterium]|nr:DUF4280 domain-containing protein [Blastocatellia bacterium]